MRHAAHDDDAALRRRRHAVEQAVDENEVPQVIDDELRLEAAHLLQLGQQHAGIADERIDRRRELANRRGARDDGVEVAQLEHDRRRFALDARAGFLAALERAGRADHVRAAQRQHAHRLETYARVAARHDDGLARQVDACRHLLGRRVGCERAARRVLRARASSVGRDGEQRGTLEETAAVESRHRVLRCAQLRVTCEWDG